MKSIMIILICLISLPISSFAEETMAEKAQVNANAVKRAAKKSVHRAEEALCGNLTGESKAECLANKAKHRAQEGVDVTKDKASEVKNAVDSTMPTPKK
jgi:uncharacterized protein YpmB